MGDLFGDSAPTPPEPGASKVSGLGPNFEHDRVLKLWFARIKHSERNGKDNREDLDQAIRFYRGGDGEWDGVKAQDWSGPKVSANMWSRDVTLLTCYLLGSDPRILARSHKGDDLQPTAEAVAALGNYTYAELKYRVEVGCAMIEALLRNKSYVFQGWNSRMWLPTCRWCDGEVFVDPDANGDLKRARWIVEEYTANLEDLLEDEDIADDVKEELRAKKSIHRPTVDRSVREKEDSSEISRDTPWDGQPGFTKLICYRVFSRAGVLPKMTRDDGTLADAPAPFRGDGVSPHAALGEGSAIEDLTPPNPTPAFDAPPKARDFDAIDKDRNISMLLVKGYDKVVKLGTWHMDHFGDTDWPYVRLQFSKLPRDEDGVPMFKQLKPLLVYMNMILSIELAAARDGARRIYGIDTQKVTNASEIEKIVNGPSQTFFEQAGSGAVELVDFSARQGTTDKMLPVLKEMHDEASGVTDTLRGQSSTEKTAAEAQILDAKSEAALATLDEALETFQNTIARLSLMAIQRYVRATTRYEPCSECAQICPTCEGEGSSAEDEACPDCLGRGFGRGTGSVPDPDPTHGAPGEQAVMPCPACSDPDAPPVTDPQTGQPLGPAPGHGWDARAFLLRKPLQKGADTYLADRYIEAWRDCIPPGNARPAFVTHQLVSLEQIRAEILVYVKKGSSRRDYQERRVSVLLNTFNQYGPHLEKYGLFRTYFKLLKEGLVAVDPDDDDLAPTDEEIEEAVQLGKTMLQAAVQKMTAPPPQAPPAPPPDPIAMAKAQADVQAKQQSNQIEAQKVQGDHALRAQDIQSKQAQASASVQLELRKLQLEETRLQLEAAQAQKVMQDLQAENTDLVQRITALESARAAQQKPPEGPVSMAA